MPAIARDVPSSETKAYNASLASGYVEVACALCGLTILIVCHRIVFVCLKRGSIGVEEGILIAALIFLVLTTVIGGLAIANGFGTPLSVIPKIGDNVSVALLYWWIFQALYKTTVFFKKLVFLTLYLRLFPNKNVTRILWTTIVIVTAGCLAFICITISECNPVPKSWLPSLPGTCLHLPVVYYAWAGFNISTDLWICLIPFPSLHCLRMPLARKVGAMLLFSMSLLTCAISAARTHAVYTALHSPHISACATAVLLWSQVEACVGIMCTCVPSLKAPISRIFHVSLSAQRSLRSTLSSRSPSPSPTPSRNSPVNHKAAKIYKGMSSDVRPLGLFENIDTRTTTTSVYLDSLPSNTLHSPRVAKIRESKERSLRRGTWGVDSVLLSPAPSSPRSTFSRDWPLLPPLSPRKHRASSAQSTIIVSPLTTDTRRDTWGSRVNSPWHRGWSDPSSPRIDHEKTVEELFTRS